MSPLVPSAGRRAAVAALALVLTACSLTRPAPVKRTFLLEPEAPPVVAATKPGTLRVGAFNVAEPFRDKTFVYRTGELQFEADFYNEFFVAPGPMIAQATGRALRVSKVFANVVPAGSVADDGEFAIEGFVRDLYADTSGGRRDAVMAITFYVSRLAFPTTVVFTREYREVVPLSSNTPDALAAGWNKALAKILADLSRDLAAADLRR